MRSKILKDKVSALNKAKEEGREEGRIQNAKNLLAMGVESKIVAAGTGLSIEKVDELKKLKEILNGMDI